jgi:queuine tRNA-ribosyltransferase
MAFDECAPYPCDRDYAARSMDLTHRWLERCCVRFDDTTCPYDYSQVLFPIVQGSIFGDLREQSAEFIARQNRDGNAIGGLSVGEPSDMMYEMTELVCGILPQNKPRYLMGVGTPENLLECIALGVDMFDCVIPSRNGRNGMLFTGEGIINMRNKKWEDDYSPVDSAGESFASREYSKAYLRHLFISNERLAAQIATIHNLSFYRWLMEESRKKIIAGVFASWKNMMIPKITARL